MWLSRPVVAFAFAGLLATLAVGALVAVRVRDAGREHAVGEARRLTELAAIGIVQPAIRESLLDGNGAAIARVDRVVRERVLGEVRRVKIWTSDGTVVYSDQAQLIGRRFVLDRRELDVLLGAGTAAAVSSPSAPENVLEPPVEGLVEVYSRIASPSGRPLLFEAYVPSAAIAETGAAVWRSFLPSILGGLAGLYLALLPLGWWMARRLRLAHEEREALLLRAIEAGERERRQIAADLHDGVVQQLAGLSFEIEAASRGASEDVPDHVRVGLHNAATRLRSSVRDLRTLLVEIYPPHVRQAGLAQAVQDLATSLEPRSVVTAVEIPANPSLESDVEALVFRVAQEGLRNAYRHAHASRVTVRLDRADDRTVLTVEDDGIGVTRDPPTLRRRSGHLGLSVLADLVRDAGGTLDLEPVADTGARLRLELPT